MSDPGSGSLALVDGKVVCQKDDMFESLAEEEAEELDHLNKMKIANFIFTLNNYGPDEINLLADDPNVRYIVYGHEVGTNGTPHLQGYCQLIKSERFSWIKKRIPRAWFRKAKKHKEAIAYCKKDGKVVEKGSPKNPGKRTDLTELRECVESGITKSEFYSVYATSIQSAKFYDAYTAGLLAPRPIAPIEVIWVYGPSGTGKTYSIFQEHPDIYRISHPKWWDGYVGQKAVLLDDFRPHDMSFKDLLKLTDIYPFRVEFKGGTIDVQFTKIYITSPLHPKEYVPPDEEGYQLLRRITRVEYKQTRFASPPQHIQDFFVSDTHSNKRRKTDGLLEAQA